MKNAVTLNVCLVDLDVSIVVPFVELIFAAFKKHYFMT